MNERVQQMIVTMITVIHRTRKTRPGELTDDPVLTDQLHKGDRPYFGFCQLCSSPAS